MLGMNPLRVKVDIHKYSLSNLALISLIMNPGRFEKRDKVGFGAHTLQQHSLNSWNLQERNECIYYVNVSFQKSFLQ